MDLPGIAARWRSRSPYLLSVFRIVTAFLFIQYGTTKLFAFPAAIMPDVSAAGPGPWSLDALWRSTGSTRA